MLRDAGSQRWRPERADLSAFWIRGAPRDDGETAVGVLSAGQVVVAGRVVAGRARGGGAAASANTHWRVRLNVSVRCHTWAYQGQGEAESCHSARRRAGRQRANSRLADPATAAHCSPLWLPRTRHHGRAGAAALMVGPSYCLQLLLVCLLTGASFGLSPSPATITQHLAAIPSVLFPSRISSRSRESGAGARAARGGHPPWA